MKVWVTMFVEVVLSAHDLFHISLIVIFPWWNCGSNCAPEYGLAFGRLQDVFDSSYLRC